MRISDWSSDVCSSDLTRSCPNPARAIPSARPPQPAKISTLRIQEAPYETSDRFFVGKLALPNDQRFPSVANQGLLDLSVTPDVVVELVSPEVNPRIGQSRAEERRGGKEGVGTCE